MNDIVFEWDENKNSSNLKKHGISFEEAITVFADASARLISDPDHSEDEERYILLGISSKLKLIIVCHCEREADIIRIISARKAKWSERKLYGDYRNA